MSPQAELKTSAPKDIAEKFKENLNKLPHPPQKDRSYYWRETKNFFSKNSKITAYTSGALLLLALGSALYRRKRKF